AIHSVPAASGLDQRSFARVELGDRRLDLLCQLLAGELRREPDRVLDRLRARAAVADDHAALDAEHRRAAVFGVVETLLEAPERTAGQEKPDRSLERPLDLLAEQLFHHLAERLGDLEDDVSREAV